MKRITVRIYFQWIVLLGLLGATLLNAQERERLIPKPLPAHPGNIFLSGENVIIPAPPGEVERWRLHSYEDEVIAKGEIKDGRIELGQLPVGYYKIVRGAAGQFTNRTYVGVIEQLRVPTPHTSPISLDVSMAWFFPKSKEKMEEVASLCQLAGINWVRDRLLWGELEPQRGKFVPHTRYDVSAQVQAAHGLHILQVAHISAQWANPANPKRFPPDLRDIYNFYREAASRWQKEVGAFEPWNEADIDVFGGHTGSEMASFQKAAYLGLKAGNPQVTASMNVFAFHRPTTLGDFYANKVWPYYDTYNLHHYEGFGKYPALYADHRAVSGGKPMWVSECSLPVQWTGDEARKELSEADLRLQSERVPKTYALALHEGAKSIFFFILPHYSERQVQYGLLRPDLTPRPGYVALAAVGRLLADAKPLGRVKTTNEIIQAYLFNAMPDGQPSRVLVLWCDNKVSFELPTTPIACFNHLGRSISPGKTLALHRAPIYVIVPNDVSFPLIRPPGTTKLLRDKPGNVVLQALMPEQDIVLEQSAYTISEETRAIPIYLYNFGDETLRGELKVKAPKHWTAEFPTKAEIAPNGREKLALKLSPPSLHEWTNATVQITGDFGRTEKPVLSLRFLAKEEGKTPNAAP